MLEQFFKDWNTAIQSRQILNEKRNVKDEIVMQDASFRFRNVEIKMYSRLLPPRANAQNAKNRWVSELFVPSTNKIISTAAYRNKTKCAIAILTALKEGRDHEDKVEARNQERRKQFLKNMMNERKIKLGDTSFTDDERNFIVHSLQDHMVDNHIAWDDLIISCLYKYHNYVTGRGFIELGINLGHENDWHLDRMYTTVIKLLRSSRPDKYGNAAIPPWEISRQFLYPKENISLGIYTVRSGFAKMYDECRSIAKFTHLIEFLGNFYAYITGISLDEKTKEVIAREERIREKIASAKLNGETHRKPRGQNTKSSRISACPRNLTPTTDGNTIGAVFGDILDKVVTAPAKPKTTKTTKSTKSAKRNKSVEPVTDGQLNGKLIEKPKTTKKVKPEVTNEEAEVKTETTEEMLPPIPDEIKVDVSENASDAAAELLKCALLDSAKVSVK